MTPRRPAVALLEGAAEVGEIAEAPTIGNFANGPVGVNGVGQLRFTTLEPSIPDPTHETEGLVSKKLMQVTRRKTDASGDLVNVQLRVVKMLSRKLANAVAVE